MSVTYWYTVITAAMIPSESVFAGNLIDSECFHLANQDPVSWRSSETCFPCRDLSLISYCGCLTKGLLQDSIFLSLHLRPPALGLGPCDEYSLPEPQSLNFSSAVSGHVFHLSKFLSLGLGTVSTCNWISSTCCITLLPGHAQKVNLKSQGIKQQAEDCGGTAVLMPSAEQAWELAQSCVVLCAPGLQNKIYRALWIKFQIHA